MLSALVNSSGLCGKMVSNAPPCPQFIQFQELKFHNNSILNDFFCSQRMCAFYSCDFRVRRLCRGAISRLSTPGRRGWPSSRLQASTARRASPTSCRTATFFTSRSGRAGARRSENAVMCLQEGFCSDGNMLLESYFDVASLAVPLGLSKTRTAVHCKLHPKCTCCTLWLQVSLQSKRLNVCRLRSIERS